jgi:hypothetical protein
LLEFSVPVDEPHTSSARLLLLFVRRRKAIATLVDGSN